MEETQIQESVDLTNDTPLQEQPEEVKPRVHAKHFSKIGFLYLIACVVYFGGQIAMAIVTEIFWPQLTEDMNTMLLVQMLPEYVVFVPLIVLIITRMPKTKIEKRPIRVRDYLGALFSAYALAILANLIGLLFTDALGKTMDHEVVNQVEEIISGSSPWVSIIIMVTLAPVAEELMFRKLLIDRTIRYGEGVSVLLSGLMFGLFHGNLNQFVYAFVLGCIFGLVYVKTGNILLTVGMHAFVNFLGSSALQLVSLLPDIYTVIYGLFVIAMIITGVIWLLLGVKRIRFAPGEIVIPKGKRFTTVFLNAGMILFVLACVAMIVLQAVWG